MADREIEILSAIAEPKGISAVYSAGVRAEHFNDPKHRDAFVFALEQWINDGLQDRVVSKETLTEQFGVDFSIPHGREPLATSIDAIMDRYRREQTGQVVRDASRMMANGEHDRVLPFLVDSASGISWRLQNRTSFASTSDIFRRRDLYSSLLERSADETFGAPLGFEEIDSRIGGIRPGELCVVAGYSGVGKSNFLGWSAVAAQKAGFHPLIVTLEMAVDDILMRLDAYNSGLPMTLVTNPSPNNFLMPERLAELHSSQEEMAERQHPIEVVQPRVGERSVAAIMALARRMNANFLLIDQLSHVEDRAGTNFRERRERHGDRIMELKAMISDPSTNPIPCMLAVQFNRETQQNKNKQGGQHNIADSADIERTADIAIGLSRTETDRDNQLMRLTEMKVRRDAPRKWELNWQFGPRTNFSIRNELTSED